MSFSDPDGLDRSAASDSARFNNNFAKELAIDKSDVKTQQYFQAQLDIRTAKPSSKLDKAIVMSVAIVPLVMPAYYLCITNPVVCSEIASGAITGFIEGVDGVPVSSLPDSPSSVFGGIIGQQCSEVLK